MSFALAAARATITKVTIDKKADRDGAKTTVAALKVEVKTSADILAEFHPSLRAALFVKDGDIRFRSMKELGWEGTRRGVEVGIRPGPDMKPAVRLDAATLRDFKVKPLYEGGQQLVFLRFKVDLDETGSPPISRLAEYLKEECWIDVHGGGELDLAPPSARTEIEDLKDAPTPEQHQAEPRSQAAQQSDHSDVHPSAIAAVRRLQPSRKGIKEKLATYHDDVLNAAIAAEEAAANCRPLFIELLRAEIHRRGETHIDLATTPTEGSA